MKYFGILVLLILLLNWKILSTSSPPTIRITIMKMKASKDETFELDEDLSSFSLQVLRPIEMMDGNVNKPVPPLPPLPPMDARVSKKSCGGGPQQSISSAHTSQPVSHPPVWGTSWLGRRVAYGRPKSNNCNNFSFYLGVIANFNSSDSVKCFSANESMFHNALTDKAVWNYKYNKNYTCNNWHQSCQHYVVRIHSQSERL